MLRLPLRLLPLLFLSLLLPLLLLTLHGLQLRELREHRPLHHLAHERLELGAPGSTWRLDSWASGGAGADGRRHDGSHRSCGARVGQKNQIAAGRHRAPRACAVLLEHG
jgi:hypothetical protein